MYTSYTQVWFVVITFPWLQLTRFYCGQLCVFVMMFDAMRQFSETVTVRSDVMHLLNECKLQLINWFICQCRCVSRFTFIQLVCIDHTLHWAQLHLCRTDRNLQKWPYVPGNKLFVHNFFSLHIKSMTFQNKNDFPNNLHLVEMC